MSELQYKQKYLKYKKKYTELKQESESLQKTQFGGVYYDAGKYIFFIPETAAGFVEKDAGLIEADGNIPKLDYLTERLGNCTRFLRIGQPNLGFDVTNKFNTIYTNQSSFKVVSREVSNVMHGQVGGISCDIKPIKLNNISGISHENKITPELLKQYVQLINEKQGGDNIGRIIVIEKTGKIGKVFINSNYKFKVTYEGNNPVINKL